MSPRPLQLIQSLHTFRSTTRYWVINRFVYLHPQAQHCSVSTRRISNRENITAHDWNQGIFWKQLPLRDSFIRVSKNTTQIVNEPIQDTAIYSIYNQLNNCFNKLSDFLFYPILRLYQALLCLTIWNLLTKRISKETSVSMSRFRMLRPSASKPRRPLY